MKKVKNIFKLILLITISTFLDARSSSDYNWMIDTINHQKVLTQQIIKEYAFLGMGNSFGDSKDSLKKYLVEYDKEIMELAKVISDVNGNNYIEEVKAIWLPIKKIFKEKPEKSKVEQLQKQTDKILDRMSKLMKIVLSKSSKEKNIIVSVSGYETVIIERMGALYMLKTWGIDDPKFKFKMRESINFFKNSLYKMLNSKETNPTNKARIEKVMKEFKFFEIMNRSKTKFIPTLIYDKTDKIHKILTQITQEYIKEDK